MNHSISMSDAIKDAAMRKARKMNDELNELRRKTKHQEVSDKTPAKIVSCEESVFHLLFGIDSLIFLVVIFLLNRLLCGL